MYNPGCKTVRQFHSFFWDTELTLERMEEISEWIGSLSKEDKSKLDNLLFDVRVAAQWDASSYE